MTLKEEVKSIYVGRPTKEEKREARRKAKEGRHSERRNLVPSYKLYKILLIAMGVLSICFLLALIVVDALPTDLTFVLIAIMIAMMVLACVLFASKKRWKRVMGISVVLIFALIFTTTTSFMANTYRMFNKISDSGKLATGPMAKQVDVTEEPFNIYITGIDQWASEKGLDLERSDVNMIVTVNPQTNKVLLTSIPRDTYVKLHTAQQMDKLTHTGIYGVDETLNTVEDWMGITINYYVKMNFTGARDIIDAIGGVDVYSPVAFKSSIKWYKYKKGWNHLSGKEAIYFARERKSFEGQDAVRIENQQRVMEAVIKKMTSSTTLLMNYGDVVAAAGEQMQTNMSTSEMQDLVRMQIAELTPWDVNKQKIEGDYDQDYVASLTQKQKFSIYRPSEESVRSCTEGINNIMNPPAIEIEEAKKGRNRSFIINAIKRMTNQDSEEEAVEE